MNRKHLRGFTLVELMITIVILAILASIAYPSYDTFIRRARMEEAKASIMNTVREMERHYALARAFNIPAPGSPAKPVPTPASTAYFDIAFISGSPAADHYEIRATPKADYGRENQGIYYNSIGILSKCDKATFSNCETY